MTETTEAIARKIIELEQSSEESPTQNIFDRLALFLQLQEALRREGISQDPGNYLSFQRGLQ